MDTPQHPKRNGIYNDISGGDSVYRYAHKWSVRERQIYHEKRDRHTKTIIKRIELSKQLSMRDRGELFGINPTLFDYESSEDSLSSLLSKVSFSKTGETTTLYSGTFGRFSKAPLSRGSKETCHSGMEETMPLEILASVFRKQKSGENGRIPKKIGTPEMYDPVSTCAKFERNNRDRIRKGYVYDCINAGESCNEGRSDGYFGPEGLYPLIEPSVGKDDLKVGYRKGFFSLPFSPKDTGSQHSLRGSIFHRKLFSDRSRSCACSVPISPTWSCIFNTTSRDLFGSTILYNPPVSPWNTETQMRYFLYDLVNKFIYNYSEAEAVGESGVSCECIDNMLDALSKLDTAFCGKFIGLAIHGDEDGKTEMNDENQKCVSIPVLSDSSHSNKKKMRFIPFVILNTLEYVSFRVPRNKEEIFGAEICSTDSVQSFAISHGPPDLPEEDFITLGTNIPTHLDEKTSLHWTRLRTHVDSVVCTGIALSLLCYASIGLVNQKKDWVCIDSHITSDRRGRGICNTLYLPSYYSILMAFSQWCPLKHETPPLPNNPMKMGCFSRRSLIKIIDNMFGSIKMPDNVDPSSAFYIGLPSDENTLRVCSFFS